MRTYGYIYAYASQEHHPAERDCRSARRVKNENWSEPQRIHPAGYPLLRTFNSAPHGEEQPEEGMNTEIYDPGIWCKTKSVLSGEHAELIDHQNLPDTAVLKAWLEDDDLQELRVVSTSIGFIKTFTKSYRKPKP
jgi:hypothetical protein